MDILQPLYLWALLAAFVRRALHPDGAIAGLNLAEVALNDVQWRAIADKLDPARLEALNLRGNQLQAPPLTPAMRHLRYLD